MGATMARVFIRDLAIVLALGGTLAACAGNGQGGSTAPLGDNATTLGVGGAVGCGLLGGLLSRNVVVGLASAAACGAAGWVIGHQLDVRDQERYQAALQQSMKVDQANQKTAWANPDTGNSGTITPLNSYTESVSKQTCRDFDETYTRDGQTFTDKQKACLQADGSWKIAS